MLQFREIPTKFHQNQFHTTNFIRNIIKMQKTVWMTTAYSRTQSFEINPNKEIVALIAYLQRLGTDIKKAPKEETTVAEK